MKRILVFLGLALFAGSLWAQNLVWPAGAADLRTSDDSATSAIETLYDNLTIILYDELDANLTVTATLSDELRTGARLELYFDSDATERTVTFSTGLTGSAEVLAPATTKWVTFMYNGSAFVKLYNQFDENDFPFAAADYRTSTDSLTSAIASISDNLTIISYAELDTNLTVTATLAADLNTGAMLFLYFDADGSTRTVTFSTGLTGAAVAVTANKKNWVGFLYNGTAFTKFLNTQID